MARGWGRGGGGDGHSSHWSGLSSSLIPSPTSLPIFFFPSLFSFLLPFCLDPAPHRPPHLPLPCPGPWHQVDRAITACAELHDLKEVVLENQKKLEGIRLESPAQVRHGRMCEHPASL